jgi:hypothetical protein
LVEKDFVFDQYAESDQGKYDSWVQVVNKRPSDLKKVPLDIIDYQLCLNAVRRSGFAISYTPIHLIDTKLIVIAIKRDPLALEHIPLRFRTFQICTFACELDGRALQFIPIEYMDAFAKKYLAINGQNLRSMRKYATLEHIEIALENQPLALQYVYPELQTYEMVLKVVKRNGEALQFVSKQLLTDELIEAALNNDRFGWVGQCLYGSWYEKYKDRIKPLDVGLPTEPMID